MDASSYDLAPVLPLLVVGAAVALSVVVLQWLRYRHRATTAQGSVGLTAVTVFLTFDLILFGAFTRLTDSGLGCPDWPGCYGAASPLGAAAQIGAAQSALPSGPVTHTKAWIEMVHRYLATGVGALIVLSAVLAWRSLRRKRSAASRAALAWASVALVWVCVQGAFGALTVTMKLYPAVVTAHLLGGLALLAILVAQHEAERRRPLALALGLRRAAAALMALVVVQVALGGWVSTNYAVLACRDFPTCQGSWWPPMDFEHGFAIARELGAGKDGGYLPFPALTAIHYVHRLGAYVTFAAIAALVWRLAACGDTVQRRYALGLAAVAVWQAASGLGNVLLGWPLASAVAHTGGAAALIALLASLLSRCAYGVSTIRLPSAARAARRLPNGASAKVASR